MTLTLGGVDLESQTVEIQSVPVSVITPFETGKRVYYKRRGYVDGYNLKIFFLTTDDAAEITSLEQLAHRCRPIWLDLGDEQTMVMVHAPTYQTIAQNVREYNVSMEEADWQFYGSTVFDDNFNGGKQETWTEESGTWSVVSDEYKATTTGTGEAKSAGALESRTDYYIEAKVKLVTGTKIGLGGRYVTGGSWHIYRLLLVPGSDQIELREVDSGGDDLIAYAKDISLSTNTWYKLRLECYKNTVKGFLDDREMVKISRRTWTAGKLQLYAYGSNVEAYFDDVVMVED